MDQGEEVHHYREKSHGNLKSTRISINAAENMKMHLKIFTKKKIWISSFTVIPLQLPIFRRKNSNIGCSNKFWIVNYN